jgi:hypothetical protein
MLLVRFPATNKTRKQTKAWNLQKTSLENLTALVTEQSAELGATRLDAIRRHRLAETAWLAVILAILTLGFAMVAWGWRNAHTAASRHASDAAHQHRAQSTPEATPADRHQ